MNIKSAIKFSTGWLSICQLTTYSCYKKLIAHKMMGKTGVSIGKANCYVSQGTSNITCVLRSNPKAL